MGEEMAEPNKLLTEIANMDWTVGGLYTCIGMGRAKKILAKVQKPREECAYCDKKPDGAMLTMGNSMAHLDCVVRKLNELVDYDWDGVNDPIEFIGFLAKVQKGSK